MDLLLTLALAIGGYMVLVTIFPGLIGSASNDYTKQALQRIYQENHGDSVEETSILKDQLGDETGIVRLLFARDFMQPLYEAAMQAGYQQNLRGFITLMLMSAGGGLVIGIILGFGLMALPLALLLGYALPYRHCRKLIKRRNRQFLEQFPDALDMIVRSVRSGFPLATTLQMLADNTEEPVRSEFRQVVDELSAGRNISQALARMSGRINEQDVKFFTVVLSVQQETGGNLGEIISNLSSVLRKRRQLRNKIIALTSEGRATAYVLGALPIGVFAIIYFMQPGYLAPFFEDPMGMTLLATVGGLIVTCAVVVKHMVNMDV